MADQPFTPHADSIQTAWVLMCQQSRVSTQPPVEELEAEFDRFIAKVKRDAAREAALAMTERFQYGGWFDALVSGDKIANANHVLAWLRNEISVDYPEEDM